jgi:hypothetical protein
MLWITASVTSVPVGLASQLGDGTRVAPRNQPEAPKRPGPPDAGAAAARALFRSGKVREVTERLPVVRPLHAGRACLRASFERSALFRVAVFVSP